VAWAVNDLGQAAGESNSQDSIIRAVSWQNDATHTPVDVGMLPGDTASVALGVNSIGQVVGISLTGTYSPFSGQRASLVVDPVDTSGAVIAY
jgi:uncharacterized membrane protein